MIQMRMRKGVADMISSQGLKSSGAGLQVMLVELEQYSLKKCRLFLASGLSHSGCHLDLIHNNTHKVDNTGGEQSKWVLFQQLLTQWHLTSNGQIGY